MPTLSPTVPALTTTRTSSFYGRFLLLIAGLGGLLYGIDVGIISAALLYLAKTIDLTVTQTSFIVAAVLGGSMFSSLVAGILADLLGRKKMMIVSGLLFVMSVVLIVLSQGFMMLFLGRLLQGISGGVIAVLVPLYLAETLPASTRGRGSAIFQFMLTLGIVLAAAIGWYFIRHAEMQIAAAAGDAALIHAAEDHAWRGMFLSVMVPGLLFFLGTFGLSETPRWLLRKGRVQKARASLMRLATEDEADHEIAAIQAANDESQNTKSQHAGSLLQRKYVFPFVLACVILACNQATGINSILGYLAVILKQAGMSPAHATQGDFAVKLVNCVISLLAVSLIDRKGRKFLLTIGTAGIVLTLSFTALLFHKEEARRVDVTSQVRSHMENGSLQLASADLTAWSSDHAPTALTVIYSDGQGEKIATLASSGHDELSLAPQTSYGVTAIQIRAANILPQPSNMQSWAIAFSLGLFIVCFAIGPGVVVWLTLSELMPTRIRSIGMGVALLLNQGVSTLIAGMFLPTVTHHGYAVMFAIWALCSVVYFVAAAFFLPETKGRTLEEIEQSF
ncbi:MAG: MFS transporter [Acidobacteriaceae bacterium]|nr:MFS transporter [Acidobacteriaceae bacterium]